MKPDREIIGGISAAIGAEIIVVIATIVSAAIIVKADAIYGSFLGWLQ